MKAAEEKHQSGGKGCWHRRLRPLQELLPRVRAGNQAGVPSLWACRGWQGQHVKWLLRVRERRSAEGKAVTGCILKFPGKTHSGQWAAAAHGFLKTAGSGWQKSWALVKSVAKLPQGVVGACQSLRTSVGQKRLLLCWGRFLGLIRISCKMNDATNTDVNTQTWQPSRKIHRENTAVLTFLRGPAVGAHL